jgi:hypothetical protein
LVLLSFVTIIPEVLACNEKFGRAIEAADHLTGMNAHGAPAVGLRLETAQAFRILGQIETPIGGSRDRDDRLVGRQVV